MGRLLMIGLALLLAACNFSVPQVTPTVAPSRTPSVIPATTTPQPTPVVQLPTETATATPTLTATTTFTPSMTLTETPTATPTSTEPSSPTPSLTFTAAPTLTATDAPSITPTFTPSATFGPLPLPATPTLAPTVTFPPTPMIIVPTVIVITATAPPRPPLVPSPAPGTVVAAIPPGQPPPVALPAPNGSTRAFALTAGGGVVGIGGVDVGDSSQWNTFARNPANPTQFVLVNQAGLPYIADDFRNGAVDRIGMTNFTEFHYRIGSRADNDKPVTRLRFAPDGTLALLIDGDQNLDDGVWVYQPDLDLTQQVMRECWHPAICENVYDYEGLGEWEATDIAWSPDSQALLITIDLPREGRRAYVIAERDRFDPTQMPPAYRYDYASWSPDAQRIIVSGRAPDGSIIMGWLARGSGGARTVNFRQFGYAWTRDAVEYNGRIYGFASRQGPGGPLVLVDEAGNALTGVLGSAPERIEWAPDNSAALLVLNQGGRRYLLVNVARGTVQDITRQVGSAQSIEWVR